MRYLDRTLPDVPDNLALDEALLLEAEEGRAGEMLRVWGWNAPAVVLGAGCKLAEDVDELACLADGVPVYRRSSGGGTVLLGRGCLLYSLVLAYDRAPALAEVRPSYAYILERIADAFSDAAAEVRPCGISDLAAAGRKFSGNAQQRKRRYLLHHGTLLYDFDLGRVARYLRPPPREPDYRAGRDHEAFLCNLPLTGDELKRRLRAAWEADEETAAWPEEAVRRLAAEKYGRDDWTRRR